MLAHFSRWWGSGLWLWVVGHGECVAEIWWWLRFCDGGGRGGWMGFVIWKRKAKGGGWVHGFVLFFSYGGLWLPQLWLWLVEHWWEF